MIKQKLEHSVGFDHRAFNKIAPLLFGKVIVSLFIYLDESGTHDKTGRHKTAKLASVGGCIAHVDEWTRLGPLWGKILEDYGVDHFHFAEWSAAHKVAKKLGHPTRDYQKNPFRGLSVGDLEDLIIRIATLLGDANKRFCAGFANTHEIFKAKSTGSVSIGEDPYKFCVENCFTEILLCLKESWRQMGESVSVIFDWTDDDNWRSAIEGVYKRHREVNPRFVSIGFHDKKVKEFWPLQVADFITNKGRNIYRKTVEQDLSITDIDSKIALALFPQESAMTKAYLEKLKSQFPTK